MKRDLNNLIYTVRNTQVMLDSDLAELFEVETKVFNQAIKRNIDRFPDFFRYQLSKEEYEFLKIQILSFTSHSTSFKDGIDDMHNLRSQNVTLSERTNEIENKTIGKDVLRSQNVTLKQAQGKHRKYLPYVFTEHGVAMLPGLLKSDIAVQMSIRIIIAFVEMRKYYASNALLSNKIDVIETKQLIYKKEIDDKFEMIFSALEDKNEIKTKDIYFNGQIYDSYSFIIQLIKKAKQNIVLIDNYIDNSVLDMMTKKQKNVSVMIITQSKTKLLETDIKKFNQQYPLLSVAYSDKIHDRFLLIDKNELYHIGASIKDLGKKTFAFSLIEDKEIINNLINRL